MGSYISNTKKKQAIDGYTPLIYCVFSYLSNFTSKQQCTLMKM